MKKLFTLLSLFLCFASGAWAINTNGAMNGVFSISSTKKVVFSQGNLQYVGTWQFAENQWDCFSTSQSDNHRDLFGWGTGDAPNKVSSNDGDYDTFTDWGTNAITNGGNTENSGWRTLTKDEWVYLFYTRENAATLFGFGSVNGMNGLIILPDNWTTPEGASFTASTTLGLTNQGSYYHNGNNDNYSHNTYTAEQWAVMESAGAVFLPAAAYRHGADSNIDYTDGGGFYWSSTPSSTDKAYYLNFYYNDLDPQFNEMRYGGRPVRLVKDVPASSIPGALSGRFTINASGEKVLFSQGNLQYQASTDTWRFAENQYDYIGSANANISDSYTGWIDLFGWATNGLEANTATGKMPYYTGTTDEDYGPSITSGEFDKTIYDWGKAIDDSWHTLSNAEWNYIFAGRASYSSLYGFGRLFGVNGVFLLPDDWSWSETEIATAATAAGFTWSGGAKTFTSNIISDNALWSAMQSAGAVFIPTAGYRQGTTINMSGNGGDYWSSTASSATNAYRTSFYDGHLNLSNNYGRSDGISVRLVRSTNDPEEAYEDIQQDGDGYYLLSSVQDWQDFATLVQTTPTANAKMTADIDLGDDQTKIGSYATRYSGTFDGQGHTLTFNYNTSSMSVESGQSYLGAAPFRDIEGATIRNLRTAGSITADKIGASGLVGWAYGTNTIENCWSDVNIASSNNIADTFTGFVAFMYGTSINITDCIFTGLIQSTSKQSHSGFIGYHYSGTSALTNCLVILDEGSDTNKYNSWLTTFFTFDRFAKEDQSTGTYTNCYYYRDFGVAQGTKATAAQLADGTTAYKLQNNRGDLVWGQRIGTDTHPVLTNDESYRVYISKNGGYTNDPSQALSSSLCSFSISSTKKVVFSKGNLQYVGSTWQFAENQWDYFGASQTSSQKDLFEYGDYSFPEDNVAWYIMSQPEWEYLYTQRSVTNTLSAGARFIKATIGGAYRGVIIFPDYYVHPDGVDFTGTLFNHTGSDNYTATVSMDGWGKMEEAGAIFLPAAGYGTKGSSYGNSAIYNSTTTFENMRYTPGFYVEEAAFDDWSYQSTGVPVRLVADAITYTVPSSGIGTFSANTAVVLPEGLEAYTCKTYDSGKSTISTQKVEGTIPANTGVLMKGTGGETYILTASSQTPEAIEGNALIAVVEATHVDQIVGEYTNFMMSGGKFVKIAASSNPNDKIPANRAYLPILTSALPAGSGHSITLNWHEETGVKAVRNAKFKVHSYYTLDGRKLDGAPSKGGVYINNGKKVIK